MRKTACALLIAATGTVGIGAASADAHTLTYRSAMAAAQVRADRYAHQRTRITVRLRESLHAYYVQVEWTTVNPVGCIGCGFDPRTETTFDTPLPVIHELALRSFCLGAHSAVTLHRPCRARAVITRVLA